MEFIRSETKKGMIFRFCDMELFVYQNGYRGEYYSYGVQVLPTNATRTALNRLVKSGYLKRIRLCYDKESRRKSYYNGYEVV